MASNLFFNCYVQRVIYSEEDHKDVYASWRLSTPNVSPERNIFRFNFIYYDTGSYDLSGRLHKCAESCLFSRGKMHMAHGLGSYMIMQEMLHNYVYP